MCIFAPAFRNGMMSSGVMAALQILVLPVKVRILARQHKERDEGLLRNVTGFFIVKEHDNKRTNNQFGGRSHERHRPLCR